MNQHIDAIYVNGVFRPEQPVNIADGERVSLTVAAKSSAIDDLSDVFDLLDTEFMDSCRTQPESTTTLAALRQKMSAYAGSLAELIRVERDEG